MSTQFKAVSDGMVAVVNSAEQSVVQVDARRRYPASGIVWSADGVIVTANHVVRRDSIRVVLPDGSQVEATLVGRDPGIDLAALRVESKGLTAVEWMPEEELSVGALLLALGRPGQQGPSLSGNSQCSRRGVARSWRRYYQPLRATRSCHVSRIFRRPDRWRRWTRCWLGDICPESGGRHCTDSCYCRTGGRIPAEAWRHTQRLSGRRRSDSSVAS